MSEPPRGVIFAAYGFNAHRQLLVPRKRGWRVRRLPLPHPSARPEWQPAPESACGSSASWTSAHLHLPRGGLAQRSHILINFPAVIREARSFS